VVRSAGKGDKEEQSNPHLNAAKDPVAGPAPRGTTSGPTHGAGLSRRLRRRTAC